MAMNVKDEACAVARLMEDGKGQNVTVIDVSELNSWTDYFVIVTITSSAHWQGLYKLIKDYSKESELEIHQTHTKTSQGNDWNLVDLGPVVVHLMTQEAREFYELEKLWHAGKTVEFHS